MRRTTEDYQGPGPDLGTFWTDNQGHVYQVEYVSQSEWFVEILHLESGETYHEQANMFDDLYEPIIDEDELGWCLLQGGK